MTMPQQSLVQSWLAAIGLAPHILETFDAAGIVNPKDLAELEICHYPALGVQEPGDRKKLFYLVQRVKLAVPEDEGGAGGDASAGTGGGATNGVNGVNDLVQQPEEMNGAENDIGNGNIRSNSNHSHTHNMNNNDNNINNNNNNNNHSDKSKAGSGDDINYTDHFDTEDEEEDGIDEVLQEQYRPLLELSSGGEEGALHSSDDHDHDDDSSSQEEIPSPPRSKSNGRGQHIHRNRNSKGLRNGNGQGADESDNDISYGSFSFGKEPELNVGDDSPASKTLSSSDASSPYRNKREEAFLSRRNARLNKLTPKRKENKNVSSPASSTTSSSTTATAATKGKSRRGNSNLKGRQVSSFKIKSSQNKIPSSNSKQLNTSYTSANSKTSRIRRPKVQTSTTSSHSQDDSTTSSQKKSTSTRKTFEGNKRLNTSSSNTTSRTANTTTANENNNETQTRRTSKRIQEKKARDILLNNKNGSLLSTDHDDQEISANLSMSSSTTHTTSTTSTTRPVKNSALLSTDLNDLESILDDNIFPISPDSASESSSTKGKNNLKSKSGTSKRLATIPSGRVIALDDDDSIFPSEAMSSSSIGKKTKKNSSHTSQSAKERAKSTPKPRENFLQNNTFEINTTKSVESQENHVDSSNGGNGQQRRKSTKPNGGSGGMVFVHGKRKKESWSSKVDALREMNDQLYQDQLKVGRLDIEFEEEMRIRIVVRKRPMSRKEAAQTDDADVIHPIQYNEYGRILVYQPKTRVDLKREIETLPFAFDNVFPEQSNNCEIYDETIKNLIPGAFEGRWASVFAYGQTGSGKTFTMMGSTLTGLKARNRNIRHDQNYGLYLLAARDIFDFARRKEYSHFTVGASLFEIYSGKLFDLLNDRAQVKCLEDHQGRVCFPGLSEHTISDAEDLMKLIEKGASNRSTGSTSANRDSSRSHAVLQLHLRKQVGTKLDVEHGRLTFIDLAGSERGADTDKASRTTRLEGAKINTSLLALKEVIRALATGDAMAHIPFRGSKLTQVLKESFVGKNSRTVMVACVAPNMTNCEHTLNTLRYADRVKERNSESGKLTAAVEAASRIHKKVNTSGSRPLTAPPAGNDLSRAQSKASISKSHDDGGGDDDWLSALDDGGESEIDDEDHLLKVSMDELNEVLKTPVQETNTFSFEDEEVNQRNEKRRPSSQIVQHKSKKEAVAPLISTHRSIMSEMLGMVKQEMTLVNCTDEDRDLIDEYLDELEQIQDKQLSMISTLRESLVEYYGQRPADDCELDDSFDALLSS